MDGQELERTALDALAQAAALLLLIETVREIAEQSGGDDEDYRAAKAALATKAARERKCRDDD